MVLSHSGQVLVIDLSSSLSLVQVQILSVQPMLPRLLPIYILFVFYIYYFRVLMLFLQNQRGRF